MSTDELNTDENRWNRLHQENLSKIGESDEQKAVKELPVFGMFTKPYMDYKYGRISGADAVGEVVGDVAKEGATTVAGGAALKGAGKLAKPVLKTGAAKFSELLSKSKSAWMARFGENLSEAYSSSVNTALKQRTMLAFEEAGILNKGQLTKDAIEKAEEIISMNKLKNPSLKKKLMELNPNGEWWKYQTKTVKVVGDQKANIHFYMDKKTKKTYLDQDYKIKTNDDLGVGIFDPKPPEKETLESVLNKELKEYYKIGKKLDWEQRLKK